ncbi:hypothetical protein M426DRAFT_67986, partial [Hypoxylon sp. CI-4A]
ITTGPAGLTALKTLREEGFDAIAFERRDKVGGLWSRSENAGFTSALDETVVNVSKFINIFASTPSSTALLETYLTWHGMSILPIQTAHLLFPEPFRDKRVLVVGIGNTACEISLALRGQTTRLYQSYRRGRVMLSRYQDDDTPMDMHFSWPILRLKYFLDHKIPWLITSVADKMMVTKMISDAARSEPAPPGISRDEILKRAERRVREDWRLLPVPSMAHVHPAVQEDFFPALYNGDIIPVRGFKDFAGDHQVLLDDDTVMEVDAVIFCTGYDLDFRIMPELEMDGACGLSLKKAGGESQEVARSSEESVEQPVGPKPRPRLPRLFQMIFPPRWASSIAFLSWMAPQENVWCICELTSMAVAQTWAAETAESTGKPTRSDGYRSPALLPSLDEMNTRVDAYHRWWRGEWEKDGSMRSGYGPMNSYSWRLFETNPKNVPGCGRKTWSGARKALQEAVRSPFQFAILHKDDC